VVITPAGGDSRRLGWACEKCGNTNRGKVNTRGIEQANKPAFAGRQVHANGGHCLQPKKATKIYHQKSATQCTSNAGKPAIFIFKQNKPYQTDMFFINAYLLKTKLPL
jgi:hypothetical protein